MLHSIVEQLKTVSATRTCRVVFRIQLIAVLTVVERPLASRVCSRTGVMNPVVLNHDAVHGGIFDAEIHPVLRRISAFEVLDRDVRDIDPRAHSLIGADARANRAAVAVDNRITGTVAVNGEGYRVPG